MKVICFKIDTGNGIEKRYYTTSITDIDIEWEQAKEILNKVLEKNPNYSFDKEPCQNNPYFKRNHSVLVFDEIYQDVWDEDGSEFVNKLVSSKIIKSDIFDEVIGMYEEPHMKEVEEKVVKRVKKVKKKKLPKDEYSKYYDELDHYDDYLK